MLTGYSSSQLLGAWNWGLNADGLGEDNVAAANVGGSVFFVVLVVCQMGHLLTIRRKTPYFYDAVVNGDRNRNLLVRILCELWTYRPLLRVVLAWVGAVVVALIFTEIPSLQASCFTGSVPGRYWGMSVGWSVLCFALNELRKWIVVFYPNSAIGKSAW